MAFAVAFFLVKKLKSYWFPAGLMQEASDTVSATADREIQTAQQYASGIRALQRSSLRRSKEI
jgi:hypothetical protein